MSEGWKCPVCGAGVAPTEKRCEHGGVVAAPNPFQPVFIPSPPSVPSIPWWEPGTAPWVPPFITTCGGSIEQSAVVDVWRN